jgi:hypothetical protein
MTTLQREIQTSQIRYLQRPGVIARKLDGRKFNFRRNRQFADTMTNDSSVPELWLSLLKHSD